MTDKIFLTRAEHFSNPGLLIKAHATRESAVAECVELVNIMLNDHADSHGKRPKLATAETWQARIEWLQDYHGAQYCYCELDEMPVHGFDDGRRVIITHHSYSASPRARKWYRVAIAQETKTGLYLLQDWRASANGVHSMPEIVGASPTSYQDAIKIAKAVAETEQAPFLPGTYSGSYGKPLQRD